MKNLIEIGRRRTLLISISILLLSLWSIYFEQSVKSEIDFTKLVRQIIRFLLTVSLLYFVYIGKNWARIIALILFGIGILVSIGAFIGIDRDFLIKFPFLVMIFIYGMAFYHFVFSKSFKEFNKYQNLAK